MTGGGPERGDLLVRPCEITAGPAWLEPIAIGPLTLLMAVEPGIRAEGPNSSDGRALLRSCERRVSVSEAVAGLGLPVDVVCALASELAAGGWLIVRPPIPGANPPRVEVLERVLDGLRRL